MASKPEPRPIMSGHCSTPQSAEPAESHRRCARLGGGITTGLPKRFHPCPCPCHLVHEDMDQRMEHVEIPEQNPDGTFGEVEQYECGGCGGVIAEAPALGTDEDGDPIYVHIDKRTNRMLYQACR